MDEPIDNSQSTVGVMSERTKRNLRDSYAYTLWSGPVHVEWNFRMRRIRVWPVWCALTTEFFNEGPVWWWRGYWLGFGVSVYRALPERRSPENGYFQSCGWPDRRVK